MIFLAVVVKIATLLLVGASLICQEQTMTGQPNKVSTMVLGNKDYCEIVHNVLHIGVHMGLDDFPVHVSFLHNSEKKRRSGKLSFPGYSIYWISIGDFMLVAGSIVVDPNLSRTTKSCYEQSFALFTAQKYPKLVRAWNFIPRINSYQKKTEIYKDFCFGRASAFQSYFTPSDMPAATGIGSRGERVQFMLLACSESTKVLHLQNALQTPPFLYPKQYGKKPPSFCRATVLYTKNTQGQDIMDKIFISGTASIRGHETLYKDDIKGQLRTTMENIQYLLSKENMEKQGIHIQNDFHPTDLESLLVYVRNPENRAHVKKELLEKYKIPENNIHIFNVDICRADLLLEMEGILNIKPTTWEKHWFKEMYIILKKNVVDRFHRAHFQVHWKFYQGSE